MTDFGKGGMGDKEPKPAGPTRAKAERLAMLAEWNRAGTRIGQGIDSATRWLLRFVRQDLPALSSGDRFNLLFEVGYFVQMGVPTKGSPPIESTLRSPSARRGGSFLVDSVENYEPLGPWPSARHLHPHLALDVGMLGFADVEVGARFPTLAAFQRFAADAIMSIVRGNGLVIENPIIQFRLTPPSWKMVPFSEDPVTVWTYRVAHLLGETASRIHLCPECNAIFLADRANQGFCSRGCRMRSATRHYRERHGLITGRPRGRPRKTETPIKPPKPKGGRHGKSARKG